MMESDQNQTTKEVDLSPALLESFINSLEDQRWQSVQDRMVLPMSKTDVAQVSERIMRVVSQLVLKLVSPAVKAQLWPKDQSGASHSESNEKPQSDDHSPFTVTAADLQKYLEITKDTLIQSLGGSASQLPVMSMLGDVVELLNHGLGVLAAESQDNTEIKGSEVRSHVIKALALAGKTLADVTEAQDVGAILETATKEVMFAITDSMRNCQNKERKSLRILRLLTSKITEQPSESAELQSHPPSHNQTVSAESNSNVHAKPYPFRVSPKKVSCDMVKLHGSCLQVLKGVLAKLLALYSPWSFSLITDPHKPNLPTLECVATDILYIVVNGVKKLCQKKKQHKKTKITEERVNSTATEMKVALQEKLREFLTCYKEAVEEAKRDKVASSVQIINNTVKTLLHQVNICCSDKDKSTLTKLEDLISEDKLSSFSELVMSSLNPLSSGLVSPAEQVHLFCKVAVKHLLRLFFLPPISWEMGLVLRVHSDKLSANKFKETTQLYDDIINQYVQLMSNQVMSCTRRLMEGDSSSPQQKKRKSIMHFFQKFPRKIQNKLRTSSHRVVPSPPVDEATEDEEKEVDESELKRRVVKFFQNLPNRIVEAFFVYEPTHWQTQGLFPI